MRIPVFARRANPSVDRPILRKSRAYAEEQIKNGLADWVDYLDPRKGIIAREYLPSGKALAPSAEELGTLTCSSDKALGVIFRKPPMPENPTLPHVQFATLAQMAPRWDWSCELSAPA